MRSQSLRVTTKSELDIGNCSLFKYELNLSGVLLSTAEVTFMDDELKTYRRAMKSKE
jgi:hypothetical protein